MLRASVLSLLQRMFEAWGELIMAQGGDFSVGIFQLVKYSTDPTNSDSIFLANDGLSLWVSMIEAVQGYSEELHYAFANVIALMNQDFEHTENA